MTVPDPNSSNRHWGVLIGLIVALFANQVYMYWQWAQAPSPETLLSRHAQGESERYGRELADVRALLKEHAEAESDMYTQQLLELRQSIDKCQSELDGL